MLVTLSSVRGSPGVTSWTVLLAAAWPAEAAPVRVVVEADCAGGVLGARYRLGVDPGALSLVSACRRADGDPDPSRHGRRLGDGLWMVPGPEVAEPAVAAWRSGVGDVAEVLGRSEALWLADLGRSGPDSPVRALAGASALNIVVSGSAIEDLVQVPGRVQALDELGPTAVLVVGRSSYPEDDLHRFFGGCALWLVPAVSALPSLAMKVAQGGRGRRSALWRAALEVAADAAELAVRAAGSAPTPAVAATEPGHPPLPPPERRLDLPPSPPEPPARPAPPEPPPPPAHRDDGEGVPAPGTDGEPPSVAVRAAAAHAFRLRDGRR